MADKILKVKELISLLQQYDENHDVILFANGENYPALAVAPDIDGLPRVEIGGGWGPLSDYLEKEEE